MERKHNTNQSAGGYMYSSWKLCLEGECTGAADHNVRPVLIVTTISFNYEYYGIRCKTTSVVSKLHIYILLLQ
jgi:hypothetical protein